MNIRDLFYKFNLDSKIQGIHFKDEGVHDTYIYDTNEEYLSGILIRSVPTKDHDGSYSCDEWMEPQVVNVSDRLGVNKKKSKLVFMK